MSYQYIIYEENKKDEIGILTLNRADKRNALGLEAELEITACLEDAAKRHAVKVIILKAAGEIFCAGHDRLEILNQPVGNIRRLFTVSGNMMRVIRSIPQCVIAQVQGIAMAAGCHLAAACDLIAAGEEKSRFGMTGMVYSYNCSTPTVAVSRCVGQKKCMEMLMTANLYPAKEAQAFGLVNFVFPDAKLAEETYKVAQHICKSSKYAIFMSKTVYYGQSEMTEPQAYLYTKEMMALAGISANATEGFSAFLDKREPTWNNDSY